MKGKKIKQINNLVIRYTEAHQHAVWTPDGRCWEDGMTLEQAEKFCRDTKDFVKRGNSSIAKPKSTALKKGERELFDSRKVKGAEKAVSSENGISSGELEKELCMKFKEQ